MLPFSKRNPGHQLENSQPFRHRVTLTDAPVLLCHRSTGPSHTDKHIRFCDKILCNVFREWWIEPGDSPFPVALSFGSF